MCACAEDSGGVPRGGMAVAARSAAEREGGAVCGVTERVCVYAGVRECIVARPAWAGDPHDKWGSQEERVARACDAEGPAVA